MPLVSVIIPTYAHRHLIEETLESVFTQSMQDVEVIVINDGSPDGVADLLRPLAASGVIRYYEQDNQGQSATRNRGLELATGEFVNFLDDDDLLPPGKLAWQVEALQNNPAAVLAYGSMAEFRGEDHAQRESLPIYPRDGAPSGQVTSAFLKRNWLNSLGQTLIRASALRQVKGLDPKVWGAEDYDLYIRLSQVGEFVYRPQNALYYRVHAGNASRDVHRMHRAYRQVRRKHLGLLPSPMNWKLWLANFRFWRIIVGEQFLRAAEAALTSGDQKRARSCLFNAVWNQPFLLTNASFARTARKVFGFLLR